jgi:predicted dienelactone hydrolase
MFGIGSTTGRTVDPDRPNWSGDGARPLVWSAWYPTDDIQRPSTHADAQRLFVSQGAVRNAAFSTRRASCPVVLLSHGTGGTAASLAWLAKGLARQGFVVIGIDHHGNTASEAYRAEGFLCWWERARDLVVILDYHSTGPFAEHLDLNRIFASGFSLGGYTAISCLAGSHRCRCFLSAPGSSDGRMARANSHILVRRSKRCLKAAQCSVRPGRGNRCHSGISGSRAHLYARRLRQCVASPLKALRKSRSRSVLQL